MTISDVLRVLRTNLLLIILFLIVGLGLGYVVNDYVLMPYFKRYTARAVLQVQVPSTIDPLGQNAAASAMDRTMLEVRQKTLAQKLLSPDLWRPLLTNANSPVRSTDWIMSYADATGGIDTAKAIDAVQKNLGVLPNPQTELISVTLDAPSAKDSQIILNGIVSKLIETEQSDVNSGTAEERKTYQQLLTRLTTQVENLNRQIDDYAGRLNMPHDKTGSNGMQIVNQMELQQLIAERIKKEGDYQEAAADFKGIQTALDAGQTPSEVDQHMELNPSLQRMEQEYEEAQIYLATRLKMYAPSSKMVLEAQAQLDATKTQLDAKRESMKASLSAMVKDTSEGKMKAAEADLKSTLAQINEAETRLGELNKETSNYNTALELRDYYTEKKNKIEERVTVLDANSARAQQTRGTVRLWGPIEEPDSISSPNLKLSLGVGGLGGMALALGIAFLREVMDTTVRSPRDITKVGQLNLLGMIPHTDDDPQAAAADLSLAISSAPNSIIAENFRQVRTRLQHAASLDTTRSLLVTSPGPGDGKTVVACNIAAGLALNGRKILLVDANFRRPELHRVFGVSNDTGFGSVLSGTTHIEQAAKKTSVPNLDVLTTGPRPANPTELLESQLLTDFIDHALEEYDHVIFDAGPILLVSETVALAPRVDGVVTVVRAKSNTRGLLQRMRDALRQLKAEHLGVVLNGVRQHTGGYYRRNIKNYYAYQNGND